MALVEEGVCEVCCKPPDACICVECPECGGQGDFACYEVKPVNIARFDSHGALTVEGFQGYKGHGLKPTKEQIFSRCEFQIARIKDQLADAEQAYKELKERDDWQPEDIF